MMRQIFRKTIRAGAIVLLVAPFLAGCASQSVQDRYYLLSAASHDGEGNASAPVVGIGPVSIPSHLDRSVVVSRSSRNRVEVNTGHRWAEPLDENIARALMDNLDRLGAASRLETFPWTSRDNVEWQVILDIDRFERQGDGNVTLSARWKLVAFQTGEIIQATRYQKMMTPQDRTIESTVAAMSALLADLSSEIARYIAR